jgi:hypothetical protein
MLCGLKILEINQINRKRYEFQSNHGFRKWFKTRCELSGMRSINIEILMGHSIGISDSYYRITETELLEDYSKAINFLSIEKEKRLQTQLTDLEEKNNENDLITKGKLQEQNDAFITLSDQVMKLMEDIQQLKAKSH